MIAYVTGAAVVPRRRVRSFPYLEREIADRFPRFGRFDEYTQIGCAAIFTAAWQAGFRPGSPLRNVGVVLSSQYGSFETDEAFYATTLAGPELASPNLFSYTLPNIVIGECALQFGWTGPTYVLDGQGGRGEAALAEAAAYLKSGRSEAMLAAWLELRPEWAPRGAEGAAVIVIETDRKGRRPLLEMDLSGEGRLALASGERIVTIDDILSALGDPGLAPGLLGTRGTP